MLSRNASYLTFSSFILVMFAGCMPKMTVEQMKSMKPQKPAELKYLDAFVGNWEGEGEAKMAGLDEVMKTSGTSETTWEGDGWYLVGRNIYSMGEMGEMKGLETWTYDTHSKKYRSTWVDSYGSVGTGISWHEGEGKKWHMKATSHGPFGKSTMKGNVNINPDGSMTWDWSEYAMGGLMKTMEMKGTSHRR